MLEKEIEWLKKYSDGRKELKRKSQEQGSLPDYASFDLEFWKEIYRDGKEAGARKNNITWHDLRKNPEDLPKEFENVLCYCKGTGVKFYCVGHTIVGGDNKVRWWANSKTEELRVISWCEISQFKELKDE